jgi:hypothetical protein
LAKFKIAQYNFTYIAVELAHERKAETIQYRTADKGGYKEWSCVRPFYRDEDWRLEYWNIEDREAGNMIIHWDPRSLYTVCEPKKTSGSCTS